MKIKRPEVLCEGDFWTTDEEGNSVYCSLGWLGKDVLGLSDGELDRILSYDDLVDELEEPLQIPRKVLIELMYHQDSLLYPEKRVLLMEKVLNEYGHEFIEEE